MKICDKCTRNRSDQGQVGTLSLHYAAYVSRESTREWEICSPCVDHLTAFFEPQSAEDKKDDINALQAQKDNSDARIADLRNRMHQVLELQKAAIKISKDW